jgi:hypothetical protein
MSLGAHVLINNQSISLTASDGIDLGVDKEHNIVLSREFSYRLPDPYSECVKEVANYANPTFTRIFIENNITYSEKYCFNLCYQRKLVQECQCYDTNYPFLTYGNRPCETLADYECHLRNFGSFFKNEATNNCSRECPSECDTLTYSMRVTSSEFSTNNNYLSLIAVSLALCPKLYGKDYWSLIGDLIANKTTIEEITKPLKRKTLSININYYELVYTEICDTPKLLIEDLVSQVGG